MQIASEFVIPTVGERVHRMDDNCRNAVGIRVAQHLVDDGKDVGEALAGPGPRREDV